MFKNKLKISSSFLIYILIYFAFISFLYFRMKSAEKILSTYSNAQQCLTPENCREIIRADILDYGSNKVSFINYGPKGIPLESGTFEEYRFVISAQNLAERAVKILPNVPENIGGFDIKNIYIPTKSDGIISNPSLLEGKFVNIELWRNNITFILINSTPDNNEEMSEPETNYIIPTKQKIYELALPTENHPLILYESSKRDFNGWGLGVLFLIISVSVVGLIFTGLFFGLDWGINKIAKIWRRDE